MLVKHYTEFKAETPAGDVQGVQLRWLIDKKQGAPNFAMRRFEIAAGGHTPRHRHAWEHEVYILSGQGEVVGPAGTNPLRPGASVFVPGDEEHQFRASGDEPLVFLCMVPNDSY
ncbi:MAG: cupin domain-containing protein [Pseudomonadota bacterium]